jgi:hypothetical protein
MNNLLKLLHKLLRSDLACNWRKRYVEQHKFPSHPVSRHLEFSHSWQKRKQTVFMNVLQNKFGIYIGMFAFHAIVLWLVTSSAPCLPCYCKCQYQSQWSVITMEASWILDFNTVYPKYFPNKSTYHLRRLLHINCIKNF